ncbi:MAG: hypothetical protein J6C52_06860 [Clostridia bacterium]|nr:hypothetical protein [Clostridia bacterium]
MEFLTDFCGGNARILGVDGDRVHFANEIRDTMGDWFYWAFAVKGAAGRTITFDCSPKKWIGHFGAAVSHDLVNWRWSGGAAKDCSAFTYTFTSDEDMVYFAHDMLYHPSRFHRFCESRRIPVRILCEDRDGTSVPCVTLGEGERVMLLTARHHCCEATGNYIMEGMLDEFRRAPMEGWKIIAIPFMDATGVIAGDQGKNRAPHDHNRDYLDEPVYPSVRKVQTLLASGNVKAVFDLHSPWHQGGRNDKVFLVHKEACGTEKMEHFCRIFVDEVTPESMKYHSADDVVKNEGWNDPAVMNRSCAAYSLTQPGVEFASTLETTYFGEPDNMISQARMLETGRCFARSIKRYFSE